MLHLYFFLFFFYNYLQSGAIFHNFTPPSAWNFHKRSYARAQSVLRSSIRDQLFLYRLKFQCQSLCRVSWEGRSGTRDDRGTRDQLAVWAHALDFQPITIHTWRGFARREANGRQGRRVLAKRRSAGARTGEGRGGRAEFEMGRVSQKFNFNWYVASVWCRVRGAYRCLFVSPVLRDIRESVRKRDNREKKERKTRPNFLAWVYKYKCLKGRYCCYLEDPCSCVCRAFLPFQRILFLFLFLRPEQGCRTNFSYV